MSRRGAAIAFRAVLGVASIAAALGSGCGAKTALLYPWRDDAGPRDGGMDAALDGGAGTLTVDCGRRDRYTTPGRDIALEATSESTGRVVEETWELTSVPTGGAAMLSTTSGAVTSLTPDVVGDWELRFRARDDAGRTASCELVVHAIVGPPVAICPEDALTVAPGRTLRVMGDGFDDIAIISFAWRIVEAPPGAMASVTPPDRAATDFVATTPGRYVLELSVVDGDGSVSTCRVEVRVTTPPSIDCPTDEIAAPTRRPTTISLRVTDDIGVAGYRWEVVDRPAESIAVPSPLDMPTTTLVPDRRGLFLLRLTATDTDGLTASCDVRVRATPTPPDAICPDEIHTTPLSRVDVMGSGIDDGTIVGYRWELTSQPEGSGSTGPAPPDAASASFTPDIAGDYRLRFTVTDDDGQMGSCETLVRAIPAEGLRIEMFWNPERTPCPAEMIPADCDQSDVDLHMLNTGTSPWFDTGDDCHYANCVPQLMWGPGGFEDDARLDIDDVRGGGPENINVDRPLPGTYRVGVHFYSDHGVARDNIAEVYVRIYCTAGLTTPAATFGPVRLRGDRGPDENQFWRVADVTVGAGACVVTDLAIGGAPNITTAVAARTAR